MAAKALPAQAVLEQLLSYDPQTGKLFWKERPDEMFESLRAARIWNRKFSGQEAFTGRHLTGYLQGRINGERYKAHRVIWKLHTGEEPREIDHINGVRDFNAFENLREVSRMENSQNRALYPKNTSGVVGVMFHKGAQKWLAKICVGYKRIHLGLFGTFEQAVAARRAAEIKHGFHPNHGRTSAT